MTSFHFILGACAIYNVAAFVFLPFHWGNVFSLVLCLVSIVGRAVVSRRSSSGGGTMFLRRLTVFIVGGFICPRCGHARVIFGGYATLVTCPACNKTCFLRAPETRAEQIDQVKRVWSAVWRRW